MKQILLIFCILFTSPTFANELPTKNLESCIQAALIHNSDIVIAQKDQSIAKAKTSGAWSTIWPKISLTSGFNRSYQRIQKIQMEPISNAFGSLFEGGSEEGGSGGNNIFPDYYDVASLKLEANQILFGTHILPAIEAANYGLALANHNLNSKANNIIFKTTEAYINILKAEKLLQVTKENQKLTEQLIYQTQQMVNVGLAQKTDLLRLKIQLKQIENITLSAKTQLKAAYSNLNLIMGKPVSEQLIISDIKLGNRHSILLDSSVPDLTQKAYANRAELYILDCQAKLYNTQAASIGSGYWPTVTMSGSLGMTNQDLEFDYDKYKDWSLGINGQWKLIDGGEVGAQVDEVKGKVAQIEEQKKALKNNIELEVTLAQDALNLKQQQIATALAEVSLAKENLDIAKTKLSSGGITNLELINSQTAFLQAKTNLITAEYDHEISKAKLNKVLGLLTQQHQYKARIK
jgi:outer membrane protein